MPKLKPHKGLLKRVKITASGKISRHQANKGHLMSCKTSKRRRSLKRAVTVENAAYRKTLRRQLALE